MNTDRPNSPFKFTVDASCAPKFFMIVGHYRNGRGTMVWGEQRTERGVKTCMTRYAKQCGLTVQKSVNIADLVAA